MREEDDQLYIYKLYGISVPRRLKADKTLRNLIGPNTKITDDQITKAQEVLDNPWVDFKPYALDYVKKIREAIKMARDESYMHDEEYNLITLPLTQIKGQAAMFGNPLISEVSAIILKFLEHYQKLDKDMLTILEAYCSTVVLSYDKNLYNLDTPGGRILMTELNYAMQRYNEKFKKMTGR